MLSLKRAAWSNGLVGCSGLIISEVIIQVGGRLAKCLEYKKILILVLFKPFALLATT